MFVLNFKLKPSKKLMCLFGAMSVIASIVCIICMMSVHNQVYDTATCDELGTYSLNADSTQVQCSFLKQFSLEALPKASQTEDVTIPMDFNDTYNQYNELQKKIGLDLSRYKGREAKEITYELKNSDIKYAVLLVYESRVIGAHLTNGEYGQENLPLIK